MESRRPLLHIEGPTLIHAEKLPGDFPSSMTEGGLLCGEKQSKFLPTFQKKHV
jgi:hypothetical protein